MLCRLYAYLSLMPCHSVTYCGLRIQCTPICRSRDTPGPRRPRPAERKGAVMRIHRFPPPSTGAVTVALIGLATLPAQPASAMAVRNGGSRAAAGLAAGPGDQGDYAL